MKSLLSYVFLATVAAIPTQLAVRETDDDCEVEYAGASSSATGAGNAAPSSTPAANSTAGATMPSGNNTASALNLPPILDGVPAIPLNDDYIHAPEDNTPVPDGAAVFTPSTPGVFNCQEFNTWRDTQRTLPLASKYLKVAPGTYHWALGGVQADSEDSNNRADENMILYLLKGGWTLDLRGVTFYIDITPQTVARRPHGCMIYVLQSDYIKIIGGTMWIDKGELFSQARVTHIDAAGTKATFTVEEGYNVSVWRTVTARNQGCIDARNPDHYEPIECNFWYVNEYDFSQLDSQRTFTAAISGRANMTEGLTITTQVGPETAAVITNEDNTGLVISSFVSNGAYFSIGVEGVPGGAEPPLLKNTYMVNPPARPGFAPRVRGPSVGYGNINSGFVYDEPGQAKTISYENAFWQTSGCPKDLTPGKKSY